MKYIPTLACILNGHSPCEGEYDEPGNCEFDKKPHELWQFAHCKFCGFVRMAQSLEWEPIDGN